MPEPTIDPKIKEKWERAGTEALKGKTIDKIMYMPAPYGWGWCPPMILFTDGTIMYPIADVEGNESGALEILKSDDPSSIKLPNV